MRAALLTYLFLYLTQVLLEEFVGMRLGLNRFLPTQVLVSYLFVVLHDKEIVLIADLARCCLAPACSNLVHVLLSIILVWTCGSSGYLCLRCHGVSVTCVLLLVSSLVRLLLSNFSN